MKRIISVLLIMFGISCSKDTLDIEPQDKIAESAVWGNPDLIRAYHAELYNAVPHGFYIHMYSKYTDEAYNSAPCCGADVFKLNSYTPDNIGGAGEGDFWGGYMYYWNRAYQYIRKINVFLEKMSAPEAIDMSSKARLVAEAKFLRAFVYFNLIERYGGVPIVTQSYDLKDVGQVSFTKNTFEECVAFIEKDLDEAIPDLAEKF